jgi:alkanesulfonate monooxygenase SsuD/methylene tetrahydromethanopterin reductase-like flavin-dependent oxidoreductase (luciferase family)
MATTKTWSSKKDGKKPGGLDKTAVDQLKGDAANHPDPLHREMSKRVLAKRGIREEGQMDTIDVVRAAIAGQPVKVVDGMDELVRQRALDLVQAAYYPASDESLDDEEQELSADDENLDGDGADGEGEDEEA